MCSLLFFIFFKSRDEEEKKNCRNIFEIYLVVEIIQELKIVFLLLLFDDGSHRKGTC